MSGRIIAFMLMAGLWLWPALVFAQCAQWQGRTVDQIVIDRAVQIEPAAGTPAICALSGVLSPAPGSRIGFEIWLPETGWNEKFEMVGNGGYSSAIDHRAMAALAAKGYAVAATDTGHQGDDPSFARDHPAAIDDWAWRAVHVTAVAGKAILAAWYGRPAAHSYFSGCSTGGHQALMEAQRFPQDFDGIIAGDPGNNRTRLNLGFLWLYDKTHSADGMPLLSADKLRLVNAAVLKACAGKDGGAPGDRFLTDPLACGFEPQSLTCRHGDASDCLTQAQAEAVAAVYRGAHNPRTGARLYYGWVKGSEAGEGFIKDLPGWAMYWADPRQPSQPARLSFWRDWVFNDPDWSPSGFDFDRDAALLEKRLSARIDAVDPDLRAFQKRGGKLIQYHGLADPVVPPMDSVAYAEAVTAATPHSRNIYRLFLIPGMQHCYGGEGPFIVNPQAALEDWVEAGHAPDSLTGVKYIDNRPDKGEAFRRPICAWPQKAVYQGGDPRKAASFACRTATKGAG
jgi:feruloyl esterase